MSARFFGHFLLEREVITSQALLQALSVQEKNNATLGNLAVSHGLLTKEEIQRLHRQQRTVDRKIGELAVEQGLLSAEQTAALVDEQQRLHVRLGEALVTVGALERKRMQSELAVFLKAQEAISQGASTTFLDQTARLVQNLLLRLARLQAKVGSSVNGASNGFAFAVSTLVPHWEIILACNDRVARAISCGLLGFQPPDLNPKDDEQSLCEFWSALSHQLGGTGLARSVILPPVPKKKAQSCELHSTEGSFSLIFVPL